MKTWPYIFIIATINLQLTKLTAASGHGGDASGHGDDGPIATTEGGQVLGIEEEAANGRNFYSFYAIPFAEPPVGPLRFKDPVPVSRWSGVRNESHHPTPCLGTPLFQLIFEIPLTPEQMVGSEDCLYLNVFTPKETFGKPNTKLPVMVFFHGGAFIGGGAEEFRPHVLLSKDIVLVVLQYRLGFLGFLSTDDYIIPGNFGLKDQTMALQWVQRNIRHFGGDPNLVTIFGQSAGATSVHYQVLSPKTTGLFQRAILQSGSALMPWALHYKHREVAGQVGEFAGCGLENGSEAYLECMQAADPRVINLSSQKLNKWIITPPLAIPRVDGDFLPDHPLRLLRDGRYNKVDVMVGLTANEGALIALQMYNSQRHLQDQIINNFAQNGPLSLGLSPEDRNSEAIAQNVYNYYLGGINVGPEHAEEVTQMLSDNLFNQGSDLSAILHSCSPFTSTFRYEYTHHDPRLFDTIGFQVGRNWVSHNAELPFQMDPHPPPEDPSDVQAAGNHKVMNLLMNLWTNFAKYGNPTPDDSLGFRWPHVTPYNLHFLDISPNPSIKMDTKRRTRNYLLSLPTGTNYILRGSYRSRPVHWG